MMTSPTSFLLREPIWERRLRRMIQSVSRPSTSLRWRRLAYYAGVMAFAVDAEIGCIDGGEHVEVDEAVVERRHQRIGHRVREPHQIAVMAGVSITTPT
jgi:hypothetical protein